MLKPTISFISILTCFLNYQIADASEWTPNQEQSKTIASVCEGYQLLAAAAYRLKQQGKPRVPGSNYLFEKISDEIYSPKTSINTEDMAKERANEICVPLVTESERIKQLRANQ